MQDKTPMDDISCIRRCLNGEPDAYEPLVRQYKGLVFSLALNTLRDRGDAADAVQDVFLKAYANLHRFDERYTFKAWVARITINHCINMNRKRKIPLSDVEGAADAIPSSIGIPEAAALDEERRRDIVQALRALPDMYRIPMLLYHQQELSYEEICKTLDLPMTLVKNRLYRARKMLAVTLSEHGREKVVEGRSRKWTAQEHGNG